jgi:tetratricopeptide (TPR) repeat protein
MLERVISLDSGFAEAYTSLAICWEWAGGHNGPKTREQVLENAEPLLKKAMQLDKNSPLTHAAIATLRLWYYWDFESADNEFKIVRQLGFSSYFGYEFFFEYLLSSGRFSEAFKMMKSDFELNKNSSTNWTFMALAFYYDGQPAKALETLETSLRLFTENSFVNLNSIRIYTYLGKYEEEIELFEKSFTNEDLNKIISYYLGHMGIAYFKAGDKSKSALILNELLSRSRNSPIGSPSFFGAAVYTAMGENDKAIQLLEKAFSDHEVEMYWLKVEPLFKPLHRDPRFEKLLMKIGFK